ncbi:hypothetical protein M404DRAFT_142131 [Pisolithus tinctorius Marx 270]|uniref:DUF659 domain-containing protein n=1 Tax=Pisolithus tinctorius Marx 270 TaxID=870435 RepID=A0A0C3NVM1_PISTI|nr:hypothetical protein M404DRAFT_142131 [Pisolithus tinctorius Marx 270]
MILGSSSAHLLIQTINEIGAEKWAAVCSDSTAVTKNSRKEIVMCIPTMLDFNNVCHHLHNTIKNITTLECFRWMISLLKAIVKHFSKSTISVAHLHKERQVEGDDHTVNGLQKIGKTRFGTHWSAAVSLQQCLTNIKTLVENKIVKFKVRPLDITLFAISHGFSRTKRPMMYSWIGHYLAD